MKTNDLKVTKNGEVMNTKKDFQSLMRATKAAVHKLGFVCNVVATNCNVSFFETVASENEITLAPRTIERLKAISKSKEMVKKAVIGYYPRIVRADGETILTILKTLNSIDEFDPKNNIKNDKYLDDALKISDGCKVLQKGYLEKPYKYFSNSDMVILLKTAKQQKDGNRILIDKVFHKKERFSIDEAALACIAYAQSDIEISE